MSASNPYQTLVSGFAKLLTECTAAPLGEPQPPPRPFVAADAPKALIFSPHPDDECIIGGLPLRLMRELGMSVINVAVTLGSKKGRQAERLKELRNACEYIGFGLCQTAPTGLAGINLTTRHNEPRVWLSAVDVIASIISEQQPKAIFTPHAHDGNTTHIGTHHLVMDTLHRLPSFQGVVVETEYWHPMERPNLMVESSVEDVADLVAALSLHVGEVSRNPYHLRLPAWMMDNVRRGAEVVSEQGAPAPRFAFATLYKLHEWRDGQIQDALDRGGLFSQRDTIHTLFARRRNVAL